METYSFIFKITIFNEEIDDYEYKQLVYEVESFNKYEAYKKAEEQVWEDFPNADYIEESM